MKMNPLLLTDFYKIGHPFQYPKGTTLVYSNLTARKSRMTGVDHIVFFGLQYFIKEYLIKYFNENFFGVKKSLLMGEYIGTVQNCLGGPLPTYDHIEALHDLGYLPIEIKALPEGSRVPMRVPCITIVNTLPEFYWLTNFLESILSAVIWQPITSATIANNYREILNYWGIVTGMPKEFIQWQGHDFSFRGMSSLESAIISGMGHLLSFTGTDTIPAIRGLETYYNADTDEELIGGSIPATEHSVMCSGEKDSELETFKRLITEVYPKGMVSIVSDTWDLWKVLTEYLPQLKHIIMARDGKVVIRPDSGDPVDIICGVPTDWLMPNIPSGYNDSWFHAQNYHYKTEYLPKGKGRWYSISNPERRGVIELLWDVFGGTITDKGYKLLDPHIGAIYGDSITPERCEQICTRLSDKGFASQCVFGIGSYTYQMNTRDTFGMAMKATYVEVDGVGREIFKCPVTDDGTKKSATGLIQVTKVDGEYVAKDKVSWAEERKGELKTVFRNGTLLKDYTLEEIRNTLGKIVNHKTVS